jgi:hypothetical protein
LVATRRGFFVAETAVGRVTFLVAETAVGRVTFLVATLFFFSVVGRVALSAILTSLAAR